MYAQGESLSVAERLVYSLRAPSGWELSSPSEWSGDLKGFDHYARLRCHTRARYSELKHLAREAAGPQSFHPDLRSENPLRDMYLAS